MLRRKKQTRWLILAITACLVNGGGQAWAQGSFQSNKMVSPSNNLSTAADPYNSIVVTQNSAASSITDNGVTIYLGVSNDGSGTQPLNLYLTTPASGNYVVQVSNDGSVNTGRVVAAGVGSMSETAVTNIYGPLTLQVNAVGAGPGKGGAEAIGTAALWKPRMPQERTLCWFGPRVEPVRTP